MVHELHFATELTKFFLMQGTTQPCLGNYRAVHRLEVQIQSIRVFCFVHRKQRRRQNVHRLWISHECHADGAVCIGELEVIGLFYLGDAWRGARCGFFIQEGLSRRTLGRCSGS